MNTKPIILDSTPKIAESEYIYVVNKITLNPNYKSKTMSAWVKLDDAMEEVTQFELLYTGFGAETIFQIIKTPVNIHFRTEDN